MNDVDISGRWVGFLTSSYKKEGENVIIPITLEIKHEGAAVSVRACFEKGYSESVVANLESIDSRLRLYYIYDNEISGKSSGGISKDKGAVILDYVLKGDKKMLTGVYFNNLKPHPNHGEIRVSFVSRELIHNK